MYVISLLVVVVAAGAGEAVFIAVEEGSGETVEAVEAAVQAVVAGSPCPVPSWGKSIYAVRQ